MPFLMAPPAPLAHGDLHAALANARIRTLYQPIVRIADCRPVGIEVLARLDHPEHGRLPADLFVLPMESAGLARPLAEAVISRAFADWGDGRLDTVDLSLSVNLPLELLLCPDMLAWLEDARAASGVPASRIMIELTESQPLHRLPDLAEATKRLRALGYSLAIDDVGPDIRDHSPLLDLPFTALKLDRHLVQDASFVPSKARFLADALREATQAGMIVIAEGVEDAATWSRMAAWGAHHAQGFLVSHPLDVAAVMPWIESWRLPPSG